MDITHHVRKANIEQRYLDFSVCVLYFIYLFICLFTYLFIYLFLGLHPQHMEVPRLGVKSELQLLTYTTATATQALNPLSEVRD